MRLIFEAVFILGVVVAVVVATSPYPEFWLTFSRLIVLISCIGCYVLFVSLGEKLLDTGYIVERHRASKRASFHLSAVVLALGCGLIFFFAFGLHELIFPAPNTMGNIWLDLLLLSLAAALLLYLTLLMAHWIESRQKRNDAQK